MDDPALPVEMAAIGAALFLGEGEVLAELLRDVPPEVFSREADAAVWRTIGRLRAEGRPADFAMVATLHLEMASYLSEALSMVPSPDRATHYGLLIRERAVERREHAKWIAAQAILKENLTILGGGGAPAEVVSAAIAQLTEWSATAPSGQAGGAAANALDDELRRNQIGARANELLARLARRHSGDEKAIHTPWPTLDRAMGDGLWPGLHMIVGGTGSGKSQLALQLALHAAEKEKGGAAVLYAALELGELDLYARLIGLESATHTDGGARPVKWSDVYLGKTAAPTSAANHIRDLPFYWCMGKPHGWSYDEIQRYASAMRRLHGEAKPLMMVIDFAQLIAGHPDRREDLRERISRAGYAARAVARDQNAVVLLLSSVAREHYDKVTNGTGDGYAGWLVGLGKESGDLEFAADSVLTLTLEKWDEEATTRKVHLAIAKLRAGKPSWVTLRFDGSRFEEASSDSAEEEEVVHG